MDDRSIDPERPLFDPAGIFWRVNRENVLLLAGGAALLSQIAHPLVAAGVHEHSGFREQPLRRLYGTVTAMQRMVYGRSSIALATAERIRGIHAHIHGELTVETAAFPRGTRYEADDPELLLWVHATLVANALAAYEWFLGVLPHAEREAYYRESKLIGRLVGLAPQQMPRDWAAFERYYRDMLTGNALEVTTVTRELAQHILYPPIAWIPKVAGDVLSTATVALLPLELRDKYALPWNPRRARAWSLGSRALRRALPYLPGPARAGPRVWLMERRLKPHAKRMA
jgi:uncharacterized protein (DUF2236 family)